MFRRIKAMKAIINEQQEQIEKLAAENKKLKEQWKRERITFAVDIPKESLYFAREDKAKEFLRREAIRGLAYRIGNSGYFKEIEHDCFLEMEVTLVK